MNDDRSRLQHERCKSNCRDVAGGWAPLHPLDDGAEVIEAGSR